MAYGYSSMARCCVVATVALAVLLAPASVAAGASIRFRRKPHRFTPLPEGAYVPVTDARHTVKMTGGLLTLGAYFADVQIGTPPQTYNVLIDTGSSNLCVSGAGCDEATCGDEAAFPRYDHTQSSTAEPIPCASAACNTCNLHDNPDNCLFATPFCDPQDKSVCGGSISYGGSSSFIRGAYVNDVVTFGGVTVKTGLMAIGDQFPARYLADSGLSGILGLAHEWNAINPTYIPTLFKNMVDSKQVDNVFGMCLTPSSGGVLDLGYIDSTKYTGEIKYVNVTKQRWYNLDLLDISFNGTSVGLPSATYSVDNDSIGTFVDSGTSVLLFAPVIYSSIISTWQNNFCHLPKVCTTQNIFTGACLSGAEAGALAAFPDFTFTFAGSDGSDVEITVPAKSYMIENAGQYCWSAGSTTGINAVLGDVLLENYYTVYDRQNARVGFAPVKSCA